ncbi:MAG: rhomboid family intramembrane serine protease [Candidatus Aenigmarchaeota archaeon]|nr:rhomboid family intramembrane serine protease [Candidatus Aenigmarchaeota archaeon]
MKFNLTLILVAANITLFIAQALIPGFTELFSLTPSIAFSGAWWQFLTYMFMHGGFLHITINMFVLLMFGFPVEASLGTKRFAILYFISGVGSALLYMGLTYLVMPGDMEVMMLGASGAVFAVLTAYGFLYPRNIVWIIGFFPLPAKWAVIMFAGLELFLGLTGLEPGIANFGHLGGIVTGALLMLWWRRSRGRISYKGFRDYQFIWE